MSSVIACRSPAATPTARSRPTRCAAAPLARRRRGAAFNRIAYSAAHVVADPRAAVDPWLDCAIDWDATIAYRQRLWSLGLGVAEAMDTAQRGMGLDWPTSLELIRRSLDAARDVPGALVACGCGTDHLAPDAATSVDDVIRAYEEQMAAIEALGGRLIVMASRALARVATGPGRLRARLRPRAVAGAAAGDPALARRHVRPGAGRLLGHRPTSTARWRRRSASSPRIPGKVDGIKISLLDKDKEIAMRRRLPPGVRMYTGDDFNYAELIAGDGVGSAPNHRHSDALLGIFDAIAPAASAALAALAAGDTGALPRDPRADGAAVAPHLPGADALLQDRRRLHGLAQRPPGPLHDGRRPAERALAARTSPSCSAWPTRPACSSSRSSRCARMKHAARAARRRGLSERCATSPPTTAGCRSTPRRCAAAAAALDRDPRRVRARAASARSRRGATRSPRSASTRIASARARHGIALSGYCRGGMFPAPDAAGLQAALDDNRRALDEACDARRRLPRAGGRRPARRARRQAAHKDIAARAAEVRDGIAALLEYARASACRWRSSRCIRCTPPTAPASTRSSRRSTSATRSTRSAAARSASRSTSTTSGGTRSWRRRSRAPASERLLAFHVCDWLAPTTDLLNDRGMMGDGVIDIPRIRGWVEAAGFAGYSEVEIFSTRDWWQRAGREVLDTCIERHRTRRLTFAGRRSSGAPLRSMSPGSAERSWPASPPYFARGPPNAATRADAAANGTPRQRVGASAPCERSIGGGECRASPGTLRGT